MIIIDETKVGDRFYNPMWVIDCKNKIFTEIAYSVNRALKAYFRQLTYFLRGYGGTLLTNFEFLDMPTFYLQVDTFEVTQECVRSSIRVYSACDVKSEKKVVISCYFNIFSPLDDSPTCSSLDLLSENVAYLVMMKDDLINS